jgi:hypothetical protein
MEQFMQFVAPLKGRSTSVMILIRSRLDDLLLIRRSGGKGAGKVKGRRGGVRGAGTGF